jgi:hypothetical protein
MNLHKICFILGEAPSKISFKKGGYFLCRSGDVLKSMLPNTHNYIYSNVFKQPIKKSEIVLNNDEILADLNDNLKK